MLPPKPTPLPPFIIHESDVPEVEGRYPPPFDDELLSSTRDLGRAAGTVNLGLRQERLLPGMRTSFTHAHSDEEELVYVLSGTCSLRIVEPGQAPREYELRAGHTVAFPAGTGIAHTLVNRGDHECILLGIGERKAATDRVFYPEDAAYDEALARDLPERHWKRT